MKRVLVVMLIVALTWMVVEAGDGTDWQTAPLSKYGPWFLQKYAMGLDSGVTELKNPTSVYDTLYDTVQTAWVYIGKDKTELFVLFDLTDVITMTDSMDTFIAILQTRTDTSGTTGVYSIGQIAACDDTCSDYYYFPKDSLLTGNPLGAWVRTLITVRCVMDSVYSPVASDSQAVFFQNDPCSIQVKYRAFD